MSKVVKQKGGSMKTFIEPPFCFTLFIKTILTEKKYHNS